MGFGVGLVGGFLDARIVDLESLNPQPAGVEKPHQKEGRKPDCK